MAHTTLMKTIWSLYSILVVKIVVSTDCAFIKVFSQNAMILTTNYLLRQPITVVGETVRILLVCTFHSTSAAKVLVSEKIVSIRLPAIRRIPTSTSK